MNPLRWIIRQAVRRRLRQVQAALRDPAATQERLLLKFIRRAKNTEWGRSHGYAAIRSVQDYQKAVPVSGYDDLAPLWHRAFDGDSDVTWPGHIPWFAASSGTTTGSTKALPVSREAIRANFRSGATLLGLCLEQAPGADLVGGKTLYFGGSTRLERRGASLQGDASGINAANLPRFSRRYRLPEPDVAALQDWESKVETICRRYLDSPVTMIAGLPSWTLILFRRLIDIAREAKGASIATVSEVWPDLKVFIHFGMAFEPYSRQFKELLGRPIATVDTYSSSEGGLNAIQSEQGDPGMQLEVDSGAFFEFVPAGRLGEPDPPRLTLGQVAPGVAYAVLMTTPAGIWAYDVGDVVRFTSIDPPRIVIAGRTHMALNVLGEHVIQEELEHAVTQACHSLDAAVSDFTVASVPPASADPRGGHLWLIEFGGPPPPLQAFAARVDAVLGENNLDYQTHRKHDYGMRPPEIVALAPGTFYQWARLNGTLGGQHKVPRVARSSQMVHELRRLSKKLSQPE